MLYKEPLAGTEISDYEKVPGSSGQYRLKTRPNYEISRRQFDKWFGVLARRGFTSYEKMGAATAPHRHTSKYGFEHTYYPIDTIDGEASLKYVLENIRIPSNSLVGARIEVITRDEEGYIASRKWYQTASRYIDEMGSIEGDVESLLNALVEMIEDLKARYGIDMEIGHIEVVVYE